MFFLLLAVLFLASPLASANGDNFPPAVSVWHSPSNPTPGTPVEIRAHALDASGISLIEIDYWVNGAPHSKQCTYTTECVASLGTMPQGTAVYYFARARDMYGNEAETDNYYFTVGQSSGGTGSLDQYVADCKTAAPIGNARVAVDGHAAYTNGNGRAILAGIEAGSHGAIASASGYNPHAFTVNIVAGRTNYDSTCLDAINADNNAPSVSVSRSPSGTVTPSDSVDLTAYATDASGVLWTAVKYKLGSGQWQAVSCSSANCVAHIGRLSVGTTVFFCI